MIYTCVRSLGKLRPILRKLWQSGRLGQDGVSGANEDLTTGVKGIMITISISHDTSKEVHGEFVWARREGGSWVKQF